MRVKTQIEVDQHRHEDPEYLKEKKAFYKKRASSDLGIKIGELIDFEEKVVDIKGYGITHRLTADVIVFRFEDYINLRREIINALPLTMSGYIKAIFQSYEAK